MRPHPAGQSHMSKPYPKPRPRSGTTLVVLVGAGFKPAPTSFATAMCFPSGVCGTLVILRGRVGVGVVIAAHISCRNMFNTKTQCRNSLVALASWGGCREE